MSIVSPNFFKRFLVITYDGLLVVATLLIGNAIIMAIYTSVAGDWAFINAEDFSNHKLVSMSELGKLVGSILFTLTSIVISFAYYAWFWQHGGQTLGMKAWHLYVIHPDGKFIGFRASLIRYFGAIISWLCFGLGFAWVLLDKRNKTWHDYLSNSQIVMHKVNKDKPKFSKS